MHTYPWHVGDFLKDCAHLNDTEELAYRRLIDLYYTQEGPIPNRTQWVAKRIRLVGQETIVGSVLREFFDLKGDGVQGLWHQKRCDAEITKYQKRADANRKNGQLGGRKPIGEPVDNPMGSKPRTRTKNHRKTPLPPEGEVAFGLFWNTYPRKVGKPKALIAFAAALARAATAELIMAGLKRHLGCEQWQDLTKVPHPTTWLNRDGWNDEVVSSPGGDSVDWWESKKGLLDKGIELGIPAPADEHPNTWASFKASVWVKAGDGPWWDHTSVAYPMAVKLRDGGMDLGQLATAALRKEKAHA